MVERRLAKVGVAQTVGLGQTASDWFVTDEDGIRALLSGIGEIEYRGGVSRGRIAAIAECCNEGNGYVGFVLNIYDHISNKRSNSVNRDVDGNPYITAYEPKFLHGKWIVEGDIGPGVEMLSAFEDDGGDSAIVLMRPTPVASRRTWTLQFPVEWHSVELRGFDGSTCLAELEIYTQPFY